MDSNQIAQVLPHRYPFLFVDRIVELDPGKRAVGLKAVTIGDGFFQGHFPGFPVMPGVLIIEALAQVAGIAALGGQDRRGWRAFLTGVDGFRFRRQVVPGDVLRLDVTIIAVRRQLGKAHGIATVDGDTAAAGDVQFYVVDQDPAPQGGDGIKGAGEDRSS